MQQCNVVNLRMFANCSVWNYTPIEKRSANSQAYCKNFQISAF